MGVNLSKKVERVKTRAMVVGALKTAGAGAGARAAEDNALKEEKEEEVAENGELEPEKGRADEGGVSGADSEAAVAESRRIPEEPEPEPEPSTSRFRDLEITDTSAAWAALRGDSGANASPAAELPKTALIAPKSYGRSYSTRSQDGEIDDSLTLTFNVPYEPPGGWDNPRMIENDTRCCECNTYLEAPTYPCRVCTKTFHQHCLRKRGQLNDKESIELLLRANTLVGWSCSDCENVNSLLTEEEMFELMDEFEKCDVDSDATVTEEEFVSFKKQYVLETTYEEMSEEDVSHTKKHFEMMDVDRVGYLTYWKFLNHQSIMKLARRPQTHLVNLLSPKEIQTARSSFHKLDNDGDGYITENEAKKAYTAWLSRFLVDPDKHHLSEDLKNGFDLNLHNYVENHAKTFMDLDTDRSGTVSWQEYLCDQAIYIIAARPNLAPVALRKNQDKFSK